MVLTEQRDNLVKLHDDKITKITDKDAEIARLLKLLEQEKEKTDILSERIDILENTLARQNPPAPSLTADASSGCVSP